MMTRQRGQLAISSNRPKKFTYGTIIEDAGELISDSELTFCVYQVNVGKSYCHRV